MNSKFLWGAATSSHQVEGQNIHNDWWAWEQEGNIEGGETSGAACDHWKLFKEDLRAARDLGLNSYRFSIEWSRCEPALGQWDSTALEWYSDLIGECEKLNLLPMATLHHFTLPQWVAIQGGFANEHTPGKFSHFVKKVLEKIGDRIPLWCTVNEPNTLAVGAYLGGYMPPARYSPRNASMACRNLLRAHLQAYDLIHGFKGERSGPWRNHPVQVGIAHNLIDFLPLRPWHPLEYFCTRIFRRFYNQSWPDAVTGKKQHFGVWGLLPYAPQVPQARGRSTVDFFGINYYTRVYVSCQLSRENGFPARSSFPLSVVFARPGEETSDLGWSIHPRGLGRMIRFLNRYQKPLYITENGIADASDTRREKYLRDHLKEVAEEMKSGADIRGYYYWSLLDNFEWVKGYGPRFGLLEVDYSTQKRTPRPSARAFQALTRELTKS